MRRSQRAAKPITFHEDRVEEFTRAKQLLREKRALERVGKARQPLAVLPNLPPAERDLLRKE